MFRHVTIAAYGPCCDVTWLFHRHSCAHVLPSLPADPCASPLVCSMLCVRYELDGMELLVDAAESKVRAPLRWLRLQLSTSIFGMLVVDPTIPAVPF